MPVSEIPFHSPNLCISTKVPIRITIQFQFIQLVAAGAWWGRSRGVPEAPRAWGVFVEHLCPRKGVGQYHAGHAGGEAERKTLGEEPV